MHWVEEIIMSVFQPFPLAHPIGFSQRKQSRRQHEAGARRESAVCTASAGPSLGAVLAMACLCAGALQMQAQGKQVYTDPNGNFSVAVPAGWQTQPQQGSPMISIVNPNTKVSVTLGVMKGPEANTPSAEAELKQIEGQFPQSCPQAKILERGATRLAGLSGSFIAVHCGGADGPQTMKFTAASKPGLVALMVTASPGDAYLKEMIPLGEIHNSLKVLAAEGAQQGSGQGMGGGHVSGSGTPEPQRIGDGQGQAQAQSGGEFPSPGGSGAYHDPQGRYSLAVPAGWNTASDNGNLTLSSGASWVSVATSTGAKPADVSHQIVQQIQAQYKNFQILNEGDFQNNGRAAHGTNATGINPKGARVAVLVVSISAGSGNYLVLISSAPNEQAKDFNGTVMQIAQSVRFAGE
jgi:hypothetical protein